MTAKKISQDYTDNSVTTATGTMKMPVLDDGGANAAMLLSVLKAYIGAGTAPLNADTAPTSPNAADDEFETGTIAIDTAGTRRSGATAWTWYNGSTPTVAIEQGAVNITVPVSATVFRAMEQPVSGSTFAYLAKLAAWTPVGTSQAMQGIYFRNNANAKVVAFCRIYQTGPVANVEYQRWTNWTTPTFSSTPVSVTFSADSHGEFRGNMYLGMEYDGTNIISRVYRRGYKGAGFQIASEGATSFLGAAPTHVGIFGYNNTALTQQMLFDWFRKIA